MKKIILYFLIMLFIIFTMVSFVFAAGIVNTPHDMTKFDKNIGGCSTCHIPHKAAGSSGAWPIPDRGIGTEGDTGNQCFACHSSNGYGSALLIEASFSEKYVFPGVGIGKNSHGLNIRTPYEEGTINSKLPYTTEVDKRFYTKDPAIKIIQCTTCHNVHDNARFRPFLRESIKEICIRCHDKSVQHSAGIQSDIVKDGEDSFLKLTWMSELVSNSVSFKLFSFDNPFGVTDGFIGDGKGRWNLGRHLGADVKKIPFGYGGSIVTDYSIEDGVPGNGLVGEIICVTCHAVHGVQDDSNANTPIEIPRTFVLPSQESSKK